MTANRARVLGVDAAGKHGWVGIVIDDAGFVSAHVGSLRSIIAVAEPVRVIGIDIPIGHSDDRVRRADAEARRFVAPRGSSVFPGARSAVLHAASYTEANDALTSLGVPKLSRQAWALVPKMREAAAIAEDDERLHEVHPEVSFRHMAGGPIRWSKKSWNGLLLRRRLLADSGIDLPDDLDDVGGVVADDVVDASAVAWSARRLVRGQARSLPDPPDVVDGRRVAIWY